MLNLLLITIFFIFFVITAWPNMIRGLYITVLLLPTYLIRFEVFNIPATLLEGMIILLFIMWVIKLWQSKKLTIVISKWFRKIFRSETTRAKETNRNLIPKILGTPILIFIAATTLALLLTPQLFSGIGIWKAYFIEPLMFLAVFIYYVRKNSQLNRFIYILSILSLVIFVYALIQKMTGWNIPTLTWYLPETRRVTTFFGYPNANGLLLAPISALIFSTLWMKEYAYLKILKFLAFLSIILTILWASSEGALIALCVGIFIILLAKKHTRLLASFLIIASIAIILFTPSLKTLAWEKITISDFSGQIRKAQWSETLAMLNDQPIMGGGLANYQNVIKPYHQSGLTINDKWQPVEIYLYPHNIVLNFWTEIGLLGLLSMIWIFISIGVLLYRVNIKKKWLPKYKKTYISNISLGILSSFVIIIVHGIVDVPYFKNDLSIFFWLLIGMTIVIYNHATNKKIAELE
jgi:O-antigen ligase